MQSLRQSIELLLQLSDSTIGLLLTLSARLSDDTLTAGLTASLARNFWVSWVLVTAYFKAATGLACAWTLRIILVAAVIVVLTGAVVGVVYVGAVVVACLEVCGEESASFHHAVKLKSDLTWGSSRSPRVD